MVPTTDNDKVTLPCCIPHCVTVQNTCLVCKLLVLIKKLCCHISKTFLTCSWSKNFQVWAAFQSNVWWDQNILDCQASSLLHHSLFKYVVRVYILPNYNHEWASVDVWTRMSWYSESSNSPLRHHPIYLLVPVFYDLTDVSRLERYRTNVLLARLTKVRR